MTDWEIHGLMFTNCSCAYGCPCQFNALPTQGYCRAVIFLRVDKGHFGDAQLDSLNLAFAIAWPGAVHQGHGSMQPIIDERGTEAQKAALLNILTGKETDPMMTVFAIYTAMCDSIQNPIYAKISIDCDMNGRHAKCQAGGIATGRGEPILNPVTKKGPRPDSAAKWVRIRSGAGWAGVVEIHWRCRHDA
jgi:hypothetical protein